MSMRIKLSCACGGGIDIDATGDTTAAKLAAEWRREHRTHAKLYAPQPAGSEEKGASNGGR